MTISDYLIDITLIALVLSQVHGRRLTKKGLLLPVGIVTYVAFTYLKAIPTAGNDLFLIGGCVAVGAILGSLAGKFTSVRLNEQGVPIAKAGMAAAALWIAGTGGRLAFQVYASHGGGAAIGRFSAAHSITSVAAWTDALILMALCEAVTRTAILGWRAYAIRRDSQPVGSSTAAHSTAVYAPEPHEPVTNALRAMMKAGERSF